MEGYGGREEGSGLVQGVHRRERERKEGRERPRAALYSEVVAHRGRGAQVAAATAREARKKGEDLSAALVGVD